MAVKSFLGKIPGMPLPRTAPRLITVTSTRQRYTLRSVARSLRAKGIRHERWTYEKLFSKRHLSAAAYVLTDFDRILPWHREMAALIYDRLAENGIPVFNDPRRHLPRDALLKQLYRAGINSFDCWRPAEGEWPARYPVFLRTIHGHRGVESDLLHSEEDAREALTKAMGKGMGLADLVFIEYCAQTDSGTEIFRKRASYMINGRIIRALTVSQSTWVAKLGETGITREEDYLRDHEEQKVDPYADQMQTVFDISGIAFGRVDFGLVNDRPQVYEVNSNPVIGWTKSHPSKTRLKTDRLIRDSVVQALCDIAYPDPSGKVDLSDLWHRWDKGRRGFGQI